MGDLWPRIVVGSAIAAYLLAIGCAGVLLADWLRGAGPVSIARASAVAEPWAWASGGSDAGVMRRATEGRR
jgi:hypothetical protein